MTAGALRGQRVAGIGEQAIASRPAPDAECSTPAAHESRRRAATRRAATATLPSGRGAPSARCERPEERRETGWGSSARTPRRPEPTCRRCCVEVVTCELGEKNRRSMRSASSRLHLRAKLDEGCWRRRPFHDAPPGEVAIATFFARTAIGDAITIAAVDDIQLLRHGQPRRRRVAPLEVANQRTAAPAIEGVEPVIRVFVELGAAADEREAQRLRRCRGQASAWPARRRTRTCPRWTCRRGEGASRCSSCAPATSHDPLLPPPSGPSHTVVVADPLTSARTCSRSRAPSRVRKSRRAPRCDPSRCGCAPESSVASSRMSLLISASDPVSSTPRTV